MRIKITIPGSIDYHDSSKLGFSTVSLNWKDSDGEDFYLSGRWFVYGFHHRMCRLADMFQWVTDVYLYRIDYDASVKAKL